MEKEYNPTEESKIDPVQNPENNVLKEPMTEYTRISSAEFSLPPCPSHLVGTPENLKKVALTGLEQIKNGQFKTHEETLKEFDIE